MDPQQSAIPTIKEGFNHLDLTGPGLGKIVVSISRDGSLHLNGHLSVSKSRLISENNKSKEEIFDKMRSLTHKELYHHKNVGLQENTIPVGGATAYYDGENLYVADRSFDYGPITLSALLKCIDKEIGRDKIFVDEYVENEGRYVSGIGIQLFEKTLRQQKN